MRLAQIAGASTTISAKTPSAIWPIVVANLTTLTSRAESPVSVVSPVRLVSRPIKVAHSPLRARFGGQKCSRSWRDAKGDA